MGGGGGGGGKRERGGGVRANMDREKQTNKQTD